MLLILPSLSFLLVSNISMMILIALASLGWRNNNTTIGFVTNTQDLWVSWCYYTTCTGGPFKTFTRLLHNSILWVITVWAQNLGFVLMKQNFYTNVLFFLGPSVDNMQEPPVRSIYCNSSQQQSDVTILQFSKGWVFKTSKQK